jgi:cation:H+ antiporter
MAWLIFIASSVVIVLAAIKLAEYGDVIAVRTQLGGMFVGALLLAGATSLPELVTALSSIQQTVPNLAAGNFFGSNMFNMLLLAVLDMIFFQARILRRVAFTHALTAALAVSLGGLVVFFLLADIDWKIGWVGVDSLVVMLVYIGGVRLIQTQGGRTGAAIEPAAAAAVPSHVMSLRRALLGFGAATAVLLLVVPFLVSSSTDIARITGLSTGFVGTVLVASVTSLPELVSALAAIRLGAFDMAVGNLFGSNIFNMFALALVDVFYTQGRFLGAIDPAFALAGLLGLLLTSLGLIGNLARLERRFVFVELDALLLIIVYLAGLYFLYVRGIGV